MNDNLTLNAEIRTDVGKGASRRLRHADKIPAIIYGADKDSVSITLKHNEVIKALENETFFSQILTLITDGKTDQAVLKDLQRHPYKPKILHMDFMRIKANEKITMLIPLHFLEEEIAPGVKQDGGVVSHLLSEVEIRCLPADLPEFIAVDMSKAELNQTIHLTDLQLPKDVEITALAQGDEYDQPVATVHLARIAEEPVAEEVEEEAAPEAEKTTES